MSKELFGWSHVARLAARHSKSARVVVLWRKGVGGMCQCHCHSMNERLLLWWLRLCEMDVIEKLHASFVFLFIEKNVFTGR